ncbi:CCA tRNA nucleotidyltransferase [Acetivibrio clariflavus]|uniref:tRNA nucleotidyltransferase/poly(A) polymerase n=1 Tax=Acetivibrio clariflavus (strain DSM 19732 / NBRC 101661 / EBR45) TaxID=720554 RepID=G8M1G3_ACECE|nr:CCA tRNA nucleotidyltransferase [Acetivibrio clariflavus]AEV69178.1 tRNA nucleotidyltransferase/poly(A) polymerase [Acetivibrio clariflavus DSM 19732]
MTEHFSVKLPEEVAHILKALNDNNHQAYIVGGCVRDIILNKDPKDWDISTSATTDEIKAIFNKTIDTGIKHGTVSVVIGNKVVEVTSFRTFNPDESKSLITDLSHRDLTINSMAYHPEEGLLDPFSGLEDIKNAVIRAVGNPSDRFMEDPLRMLRAVRFSATLGFDIDKSTLDAIKSCSQLIVNISRERIRDELTKILISNRPFKFILLRDVQLLKYILPEFDICFDITQNHPYHIYNVAEHSLKAVSEIENDIGLRWAILLHDTGKAVTKFTDKDGTDHFYGHPEKSVDIAKNVLERLKFDNKTIAKVCRLIRHHDKRIQPDFKSVRKAVNTIGEDFFMDLLKVQEADKKGQNPEFLNTSLTELNKIKEIYKEISNEKHCLSVKDLKINGRDLIALGFRQSKEIGCILEKLLNNVLEKPELNTYNDLIEMAKSLKNQQGESL